MDVTKSLRNVSAGFLLRASAHLGGTIRPARTTALPGDSRIVTLSLCINVGRRFASHVFFRTILFTECIFINICHRSCLTASVNSATKGILPREVRFYAAQGRHSGIGFFILGLQAWWIGGHCIQKIAPTDQKKSGDPLGCQRWSGSSNGSRLMIVKLLHSCCRTPIFHNLCFSESSRKEEKT